MKTFFYTLMAAAALATAFAVPASAGTIASATFDTGASGWSSQSFLADPNDDHPIFTSLVASYSVTWSGTGGNPGGAINAADQDSGWQYFSASSAFLGNQSAALGGTISFDLERTDANTSFPPQNAPPLAITDGTTVLVFAPAVSAPVNGSYTTYTIGLTTLSGGVFVTSETGALATQAQLDTVLSNLTGLYILGDWVTGIGDAYNLDNVILSGPDVSSVPEPSSYGLMMAGGLALLAIRKRA